MDAPNQNNDHSFYPLSQTHSKAARAHHTARVARLHPTPLKLAFCGRRERNDLALPAKDSSAMELLLEIEPADRSKLSGPAYVLKKSHGMKFEGPSTLFELWR